MDTLDKIDDIEIDYSSITTLNLSEKKLTELPKDISKYINLIELDCQCNQITKLDN